jgi:lysozyme family protein
MIDDWAHCSAFSLRMEAGYVSAEEAKRRGDPGGETNFGICKRDFPDIDIKNLTQSSALALYKMGYWDATGWQHAYCDRLAWPLNQVHFDCVINIGNANRKPDGMIVWTGHANQILQRGLGVKDDGLIGPRTLATAGAAPLAKILQVLDERRKYYRALIEERPAFETFRHSWLTRCDLLEQAIRPKNA